MIRDYRDLTRLEMEGVDRANTLVLIPIGALEQHGAQAPLGTDDIIAEGTVERLRAALDREEPDFPLLVFPVLPVGLSTEHRNFCGSVTLKPDTLYRYLHDVCTSLAHHGFRKLVFLICHGGNTPVIQILSRELRSELGIGVFLLNAGAYFGNPDVRATVSPGNVWDFHGGEMETSMVLAQRPETVKLEAARPGVPRKFEGNRAFTIYGPVTIGWVSEEWTDPEGNPIGIGGDPRGATAEKGEIIYKSFVSSMLEGLREIRDWDPELAKHPN